MIIRSTGHSCMAPALMPVLIADIRCAIAAHCAIIISPCRLPKVSIHYETFTLSPSMSRLPIAAPSIASRDAHCVNSERKNLA